jgi:hypothetical protein
MDNHDKAHYAASGVIAAGLVGVFALMPAAAPNYPVLGSAVARSVMSDTVKAVQPMLKGAPFWVLCGDDACTKIQKELMKAAKSEHLDVKSDRMLWGSDNVSVGAPTKPEAEAIKAAVEKASGGVLKVGTVVSPHIMFYLAFGKIS